MEHNGKEAKTLVIDEIHTNQGGCYKLPNGLYAHYSCGEAEICEELEAEAVDIEDTEIVKAFEQALREHNEYRYKTWLESKKESAE